MVCEQGYPHFPSVVMIYFRFTNSVTNKIMDLAEIDNELRAKLGLSPDPDHFCTYFWEMTGIGDMSFDNNGDFVWIRFQHACLENNVPYDHQKIYESFLFGKYIYHSWR